MKQLGVTSADQGGGKTANHHLRMQLAMAHGNASIVGIS
jgi:hypothetical protein